MSKYTTEVRYIVETFAGLEKSVGYSQVNETIAKALPKIFNFDFPIFDEAYRSVLETKIIKHYYTREIGAETVGLWQLWMDTKLNEIMPYYNQLYKSQLLSFNPLYDYDLWRTHNLSRNEDVSDNGKITRNDSDTLHQSTDTTSKNTTDIDSTGDSETDNTSSTTGKSSDKYSDTPQGQIHLIESMDYLTNARIIDTNDSGEGNTKTTTEDNSSSTSNNTGNSVTEGTTSRTSGTDTSNSRNLTSVDDYLEHVSGKTPGKTYSAMLQEYRQTFINIDMMIIKELNTLFMGMW